AAHEVDLERRAVVREGVEPEVRRAVGGHRHQAAELLRADEPLDLLGRDVRVDVVEDHAGRPLRRLASPSAAARTPFRRLASPSAAPRTPFRRLASPSAAARTPTRALRTIAQKYSCTAGSSVSSGWKVATRTLPCRAITGSSRQAASVSPPAPTRRMRGARMKTTSIGVARPSRGALPRAPAD